MSGWVGGWCECGHVHAGFRLLCSMLFPKRPRKSHYLEAAEVRGYWGSFWGLDSPRCLPRAAAGEGGEGRAAALEAGPRWNLGGGPTCDTFSQAVTAHWRLELSLETTRPTPGV